jgi:hypothetical protein
MNYGGTMQYSVNDISEAAYPPLYSGERYLAVLRAYCDESFDKNTRVYAVAGFVGRDKDWRTVSKRWRNRCLKDGIDCYHAAACESQVNDFSHLSVPQSIALNTDLISDLDGERIKGFGVAVYVEDYEAAARTSPKAAHFLTQSPYFLAMQFLIVDLCCEIAQYSAAPVAFIFEQQDEFSGRAKALYDEVREKNPTAAKCMGSLTYAPKDKFTPLQMADKLVYEVMKAALNTKYDPSRAERKSLTAMKDARVISTIRYLDFKTLELLVSNQPDTGKWIPAAT